MPSTLAPGDGVAVRVPAGATVGVTLAGGPQVVDSWFFADPDPAEHVSMEHCRVWWLKLWPEPGDALFTNRHRALATLAEDTSPRVHDTLLAACNPDRYRVLGAAPGHANCEDTLHRALAALGLSSARTPQPLNLFMNIPAPGGNRLGREPTPARRGDRVVFRAEAAMVAVFSACPMDLATVPISGAAGPQGGVEIAVA
jgi:uncharacterized protein YcgI (DUF1989 family)